MKLDGDRIKELTLDLVRIKSVVGTKDESLVSERIHKILSALPYFREHPEHLFFVDNVSDPLERKSLVAMVKGRKDDNPKTAVLIGHVDTVGTSDYGMLEEYATEPLKLSEKLGQMNLPVHVMDDLLSGNFLFGRGILDMKSGVSVIINLLETAAENLDAFSGNLAVSFVSDEEGSSKGMLSCVPELARLKKEHGLDYQLAIDTDYTSMRTLLDPNRYLYAGTVGKIMPSFYVVGKETHVGDPFGGLDSNELAAKLVEKINLSVGLSDEFMGETTVPPVTLRLRDLKPEYSVQTNRDTSVYFNFATHISTPDMVLEKLRTVAEESFQEVIQKLNEEYFTFTGKMDLPHILLPWKTFVIAYDEIFEEVVKRIPDLQSILDTYARELMENGLTDEREIALLLVKKLHTLWDVKDPVMIMYFSPPYYPHMAVTGKTQQERTLLEALDALTTDSPDRPIKARKFYPYISDLSYFYLPEEEAVESLRKNMPGFGTSYTLPLEDIRELSLPVTNIGPYGFDAHQYTERIEVDYSFYTLPDLVLQTVLKMLK